MTQDKFAVVVVDFQNDFVQPDGALYVPGAEKLIDPIEAYLEQLDPDACMGVMYTQDTHYQDTYYDTEESKQFPIHCVRGSSGHDPAINIGIVDLSIGIALLEKGVFNMWEEANPFLMTDGKYLGFSSRDAWFDDLKQKGVKTIDVIGVASDYCVKYTIQGLLDRGFSVNVIENLTAGIERDIKQVVMEDFAEKDVDLV